jgi:hypothetical protein
MLIVGVVDVGADVWRGARCLSSSPIPTRSFMAVSRPVRRDLRARHGRHVVEDG